MSYPWFRLHTKGWLTGTIRDNLTMEERSVWADLLAMASESRVRGVICRAKGVPYTREYIANYLDVPLEILNSTIEKSLADENADDEYHRLELDEAGCLHVMNWDKYQPDGQKRSQDSVTLSAEDKAAARQAAAARLGYLEPDAAQRGITNRLIEQSAKNRKGADNG